ncbi:adenylate/guanylate cyclase domain-containing protein [Sphingobacterium sp. Lzh-3]|uniref:adenylate/guanylate cyclase domain-containing protein n=1 Tax=Sphingobacterium sp. Lzh-3 TaxID=3382150 RepID=UPI00398D02AE
MEEKDKNKNGRESNESSYESLKNRIKQLQERNGKINYNIEDGGYSSLIEKYKHYSDINKIISNSQSKIAIDEEIIELKRQLIAAKGDKEKSLIMLKEIENKQKSSHIINRIHEEAVSKYLNSGDFRANFEHGNETFAVVVSIDIRRSTELMLKAKTPTDYSNFITELSDRLSKIIIGNFGIFDKFTGDGILAFFPHFYSGKEAILRALKAAEECHLAFYEHYKNCRNKFTVFIKDVGLGIGIDCGIVSVANTSSELTVVGIPVVYACRFSGAKAGDTLLNMEAYQEVLDQKHAMIKDIEETEIHIKNEGIAMAFKVKIDKDQFSQSDAYPWEVYEDDVTSETTPAAEEAKTENKKKKGA